MGLKEWAAKAPVATYGMLALYEDRVRCLDPKQKGEYLLAGVTAVVESGERSYIFMPDMPLVAGLPLLMSQSRIFAISSVCAAMMPRARLDTVASRLLGSVFRNFFDMSKAV